MVTTVRALLDGLKASDADLEYEIELPPATYREPWRGKKHLQPGIDVPTDATVIQVLRRSHIAVLGHEPEAVGVQYPCSYAWTDAGHLAQAGCQAVVYGPTQIGQTYVELDRLEAFTRVVALTSLELCGAA